ncbi:Rho termination factor N-terminal domain-containing protein [Domibacillus mangrovi]|uniref:Rho termination factor-like N-terminal domain-containing protein n=1 Tax=Domibacillus mangrovi TaxID=1714354 RepID=A0A1Q5P462_9BACI|nr:Rho termination factor N-terminal domain-containing protein [Domibacillus mangrovi]OKL36997.1 hypothetical protein BLL40_05240 [Domibacillus mangrovi]
MPKYISNAYLAHAGKIVQPGEPLELTEEQADRLGDKVELSEETQLGEKTVSELKEEAKAKGIEGYVKMKKDELIDALAKPAPEGATEPFTDDTEQE